MDGNGRWAAAKGLPRLEGHRRGAERLIETVDACIDAGVNTLTVFAFSAENWKRPLEEVSGLFKLGEWILRAHLARLEKRNVRLHVIGDITALPDFVRSPLEDVIKSSKDNTAFNLVVALNYGARQEIVAAARSLAADVAAGRLPPTIILTTFDDDDLVLAGIRAGAKGYMLKDVSLEQLAEAIQVVSKGGSLVLPAMSQRLLSGLEGMNTHFVSLERPDPLTERETEILRLMAGGFSNKEIANSLHVAEGTIKNHVSNILSKLGVRDRTRAVLKAFELKIV